ncbi:DUF3306 domain-containing protein [Shewanella psychropiezotolerans]|uniref:DUF3306 domain-containing protein n=1 Tax=Shewanella psychropiezotolerans TaxID=2593655 RepID=A0ABX5X4P1_9GAMM|nr:MULTISPECIES: DUF3306 domain-containing protein [Shewanella]MPY25719.1 DUF3306 domain-containing protein [Shewanella sp. YLB-07]QDO86314.1 DUF3306 domain-containing protein [Shewanella psychropiezotolerans]
MSNKPSGLFSRWTQRRQQVEEERLAEEAATARAQEKTDEQDLSDLEVTESQLESSLVQESDQEATDEAKVLTAEDLPDPDKIEVGGSFASFMGANVDPTAKAAALKALWKQPQYNEIDGLLEYALDYSNQPKLSAEQSAEIAKKIFRHVTKKEDEVKEQELAQAAEDHATESADESTTASLSNETHIDSEAPEDILDIESDDLSQNAPDSEGETKETVV